MPEIHFFLLIFLQIFGNTKKTERLFFTQQIFLGSLEFQ